MKKVIIYPPITYGILKNVKPTNSKTRLDMRDYLFTRLLSKRVNQLSLSHNRMCVINSIFNIGLKLDVGRKIDNEIDDIISCL